MMTSKHVLLPLVLLLTGCASASPARISQDALALGLAQCAADGRAVWLDPPQPIERILILGGVEDPQSTQGRIVPTTGLPGLGDLTWATFTTSHTADVFVTPNLSEAGTVFFGPTAGAPTGVYRITASHVGDPACAEYEESRRRYTALLRGVRGPYAPHVLTRGEVCYSYRYVGPLDLGTHTVIAARWFDRAATQRGYQRLVEEVRADGRVLARAVVYAIPGVSPPPGCFARSTTLSALGIPGL